MPRLFDEFGDLETKLDGVEFLTMDGSQTDRATEAKLVQMQEEFVSGSVMDRGAFDTSDGKFIADRNKREFERRRKEQSELALRLEKFREQALAAAQNPRLVEVASKESSDIVIPTDLTVRKRRKAAPAPEDAVAPSDAPPPAVESAPKRKKSKKSSGLVSY